ncbi:MAG: hypothetical protein FWD57_03800 [Polyangiaceae bacterium]|nr:hypothetical protein [Polyangiaceae bacterium]
MAQSPNQASDPYEPEFQLPIRKTNPLVFIGIGAIVVAAIGIFVLTSRGKPAEKPQSDLQAAAESARMSESQAKAQREAQIEHLERAAKAWAIASEQERAAAVASAQTEPPAAENKPQSGGGAAPKRGSGAADLDQLDKMGSAINSQITGP